MMIHATDDVLDLWYDGYYNLPPAVLLRYAIIFPRIYLSVSHYGHSKQRLFP
jgi:hypothetical protein